MYFCTFRVFLLCVCIAIYPHSHRSNKKCLPSSLGFYTRVNILEISFSPGKIHGSPSFHCFVFCIENLFFTWIPSQVELSLINILSLGMPSSSYIAINDLALAIWASLSKLNRASTSVETLPGTTYWKKYNWKEIEQKIKTKYF